jgi:hypothetical protein
MHIASSRTLQLLVLAAVIWLGLGVAAFHGQSTFAYRGAEVFSIVTTFIWPGLFGVAGLQFAPKSNEHFEADRLVTFALGLSAMLSYFICLSVLARASEVVWRNGKFGDPTVSLGLSAAKFFGLLVVIHLSVTYYLAARARPGTLASKLGFASLGMATGACAVYIALGISPFATWRA